MIVMNVTMNTFSLNAGPMRTVRCLAGVLESFIALLLAVIFLLCLTLVILRYVFASGFAGAEELMRYLFVYTTALGTSLAVLRDEHIRISVFIDRLPAAVTRWAGRLRQLLVFAFNGLLGWLSLDWIAQVGDARSAVLGIPTWVVQSSVPIGALLVMLLSLAVLIAGERPAMARCDAEEGRA